MTNSPASSSEDAQSSNFTRLHPKIQRWIWEAKWSEMKDAQELAIPVILEGIKDVIIAAPTASGKTEAAFLPILTSLLDSEQRAAVLYVSPLKALINDQWERLSALCERLDITVAAWHGDVADSRKRRFLKLPHGVLLITPESLEALLMRQGHGLARLFSELRFVVVDEFHAFLGTERGKQLQSLLHRIEVAIKRRVPRIGLSATLGEMKLAADFLRPGEADKVATIVSSEDGQELKAGIMGFLNLRPKLSDKEGQALRTEGKPVSEEDTFGRGVLGIGEHMFMTLRGANNLIFPNSRGQVEMYSDLLRRLCERNGVPNQFWPHHGNLSKEIREETEAALKSKERPATAICTTTLELGIDIGAVKSIAQIGPAPSVASLRQRLGRSGRRKGEPAILRCYNLEREIGPNRHLSDELREGLAQTIAQIRLVLEGWYEAPRLQGLHLSTLVQQLLSALAQYGGITAKDAWRLLCDTGPFANLSQGEFAQLLRGLAEKDVLIQDSRGLLLHGPLGERLIGHYSFYAAFHSDEEFRLVCGNRTLGSIPISRPLEPGRYVIFAGRRWIVLSVDQERKVIEVAPDKAGVVPSFDGMGGKVHDRVREEMRVILREDNSISFIDAQARKLLVEGRATYKRLELDKVTMLAMGTKICVFLWKGDWVQDTVALMLCARGSKAVNEGLYISVQGVPSNALATLLRDLAAAPPGEDELMEHVANQQQEKWDLLLPRSLLARNYVSHNLDIQGAQEALRSAAESRGGTTSRSRATSGHRLIGS